MTAGAPPKYKTVKDLQAAISDYFDGGIAEKTVWVGKGENAREVTIPIPTISGLAYHLGFASRQSFYDYEKVDKFSYTIKRARLFIEKHYEELLQTGTAANAIFALKNFGWKDTQDISLTTKLEDLVADE